MTTTTYTFDIKTYNGVSIIVNNETGYVNASKMGSENRRTRKFLQTDKFQEICAFFKETSVRPKTGTPILEPILEIMNVRNEFKGIYVHPKLVHFVAEWVDLRYAFMVSSIMDSINNKVHEVLEEKQIEDTVENTKPILENVVSSIAPIVGQTVVEEQLWGCRDSAFRLDSYEKADLKNDINEYNTIKEELKRIEEKVDKWGSFVEKYYPEFTK